MISLVGNGVHLSTEVGQSFERINQDIATTAALVSEIASAMQEQNAGTDQILQSTGAMVEASNVIRDTAAVQQQQNLALKEAVARITASFEVIRSGAQTVTIDAHKIEETVARLEAFTENNNAVVDRLAAVVQAMGGPTMKDTP